MMTALINNEYFANALDLYKNKSFTHLLKTEMTYALAIKACQSANDFECGKRIISETNHSLLHSNIQIKNTLIDFYGHCGDIGNAKQIFASMKDCQKDIISINAMMSAYLNNANMSDANQLFYESIPDFRLRADATTFSILLNRCSHCGGLRQAMLIYIKYVQKNEDKRVRHNPYIITCLVDC